MNDWVACETCKTIYEYDPVRRIAQCPYCQKPEYIPPERESKKDKADRERVPTDKPAAPDRRRA